MQKTKGAMFVRYKGKVYRPPSEAYSLIVQVTYGCSHNRCAFCEMYDDKHFSMRPMQEIREDFELARRVYHRVDRVFLADGDALMRRIHGNYRAIIGFNFMLICLGVAGVLPLAASALLHNTSTLLISLHSMTDLLPRQEALPQQPVEQ